jgi:hypothetical protein
VMPVPFMQRLEQRWDQRTTGLEPLTVEATIEIARPPLEVWDFLLAPASAMLTGTGVVKTFRVPGTPVGAVGEQQCLVYDTGGSLTIHMAELIELEPLHKIVTRFPTMPTGMLNVSTLTPTDTGTSYTDRLGFQIARGSSKKVRPDVLKAMNESNIRLKACVEAGTRFPGPEA